MAGWFETGEIRVLVGEEIAVDVGGEGGVGVESDGSRSICRRRRRLYLRRVSVRRITPLPDQVVLRTKPALIRRIARDDFDACFLRPSTNKVVDLPHRILRRETQEFAAPEIFDALADDSFFEERSAEPRKRRRRTEREIRATISECHGCRKNADAITAYRINDSVGRLIDSCSASLRHVGDDVATSLGCGVSESRIETGVLPRRTHFIHASHTRERIRTGGGTATYRRLFFLPYQYPR